MTRARSICGHRTSRVATFAGPVPTRVGPCARVSALALVFTLGLWGTESAIVQQALAAEPSPPSTSTESGAPSSATEAARPPATAVGPTSDGATRNPAQGADESDRWFALGVDAYKADNFVEAERCLRRAWELKRTYDIAGNLGQTLFKLGRMRESAEVLTDALVSFPPSADPDKRERMTQLVAKAKATLGTLRLQIEPQGAHVRIDDRDVGVSPLPAELFVEPGAHRIEITLSGYEGRTEPVEIAAGGAQAISLSLEPTAESPTQAWVAGIGFGLGGAGLVGTVVLVVLASSQSTDFSDARARIDERAVSCPSGATDPDCVALRDADESRADLSNAAMVVGLVSGVVVLGAVIATAALGSRDDSRDDSRNDEPPVALLPWATPSAGGLVVQGRF